VLIILLYEYANLRMGIPGTGEFGLSNLNGFRAFAGHIAGLLFGEVSGSLTFLLTLFLLRALLKKQWIVGAVWVIGWVAVRFCGLISSTRAASRSPQASSGFCSSPSWS